MSDFFSRSAQLIVGTKEFLYPEFTMDYEIEFDADPEPNISKISITNLSKTTISEFKQGQPIVLNAGYTKDIGSIISGVVYGIETKTSGTENTTTIKCVNVVDQYLNSTISKTYKGNVKASFVLNDISKTTGVKLNLIELYNDVVFKRGFVAKGKVIDVYKKIASTCKSSLIINQNVIEIIKPKKGYTTGFLLSSNTGLISIERKEEQDKQCDYKVEMFLNHAITTRSIFQIKSKTFNGFVMVVKGKHKGWRTEVEVVIVG